MAERDYSDVVWPWDGDPNWDAPREGATSSPGQSANWQLRCRHCDLRFPDHYTVANMEAHSEGQHDGAQIELNLVWVGLGTPPQPPDGLMPS